MLLSTRPECDVVVVSEVGAGAEGSNFRISAEVLLEVEVLRPEPEVLEVFGVVALDMASCISSNMAF